MHCKPKSLGLTLLNYASWLTNKMSSTVFRITHLEDLRSHLKKIKGGGGESD